MSITGKQQVFAIIVLLILTSIITVAVVLANLGLFGESEVVTGFATWGLGGVLVVIVTTAVGIAKGLFTKAQPLVVSVDFSGTQSSNVQLESGAYELFDIHSKKIGEGTLSPVPRGTGWECTIPPNAWESYFIKLDLMETGGAKKWRVGPFTSFTLIHQAEMVP